MACYAASACAAVGNYAPGGQPETFAEAWDGSQWKVQRIALPPGTIGSILYGMACTSAACTAVGSYYGAAQLPVTLAITSSGRG